MSSNIDWDFPYVSKRAPVLARNVVASSQPLATQAGLEALRRGGNAVDAALATAITLTVVEPCSNGVGSDAFAIVWDGSQLHGLNASGKSPQRWSPEKFLAHNVMPTTGWDSITVPGAVSSWVALSKQFGALPFHDLFESAINYAEHGFPVGHITARVWDSCRLVKIRFIIGFAADSNFSAKSTGDKTNSTVLEVCRAIMSKIVP